MRERALNAHDVGGVLRLLRYRGVNRAAAMVRNSLKQMFGWAEKRQPWRNLRFLDQATLAHIYFSQSKYLDCP